MSKSVVIDGVRYAEDRPAGNRHVVVLDNGFVFAGDLEETGRVFLTRVVNLRRWQKNGLGGAIAINLYGGLVLLWWLMFGNLSLPPRGFVLL